MSTNQRLHASPPHGLYVDVTDGIARVRFDVPGAKVNTLGTPFMQHFEELVESLAQSEAVRGVVLISGKPDNFIAGADLDEIEHLESAAQAADKARFGQRVFARIESLGKPVVAAVHGTCLGGGCELVLACHARVLSDDPSTRIGLPEVRLGIIPGFGGTQRLPRIVGLQAALDLILTGKQIDARRALRLGLADALAYPALLESAAREHVQRLIGLGRFRPDRASRLPILSVPGFLDRTPLGRAIVLGAAAKRVRKQTGGHYPAPLAAIRSVQSGLRHGGRDDEGEARLLGEMAMTPVSRNLLRIFRLTEANKKTGAGLPAPADLTQIGVVGAGVMGGGIAQLAAKRDLDVRLKDIANEALLLALRTAHDLTRKAAQRERLDARAVDNTMARIHPTLDLTGFRRAGVVIEAVVENLDVKQKVLRELEAAVGPECVLATNTSALSVTAMASVLERPQRVVGMHFFNPVHRMPLVEIVTTVETDPHALSTVLALTRRLGKTPVIVRDAPGFLVNRILAPYMNESAHLFEQGCDVEPLDAAFRAFGMPMGPFELLDEVGTDVAAKVGRILHAGLGEHMQPAGLASTLAAAGRLGRKSGAGVYLYVDGKRRPDRARWKSLRQTSGRTFDRGEVVDRVLGLMLNEAARCLDEGVVSSPSELDLALVYGIGFPPFHGGLLRWAETRGLGALVERMREFETRFGPRFAPSAGLLRMAAAGSAFAHAEAKAEPEHAGTESALHAGTESAT